MTSLLLAASPMAYLLICAVLRIRALRRRTYSSFAFDCGAWRVAIYVEFHRVTIGVYASRIAVDVHLPFLLINATYREDVAARLAQSKADAKAVDALLSSLQKQGVK